jgi:hypothetical protein
MVSIAIFGFLAMALTYLKLRRPALQPAVE